MEVLSVRSTTKPSHVSFQRPYDPVISFRNSQGELARGTLTSVQRRALVMEVYNPYSIVQISEVLSELSIRSGDRLIYQGKAVVVGLLNTGLMALVSVTLIDEWNDLGGIGAEAMAVANAVNSFLQDWDARATVGAAYQMVVNDLRAYFSEVTRWLDQADLSASLPREADGRVREDIFLEIAQPLLEKSQHYLRRFEAVAASVPPEDEVVHRAFAQAALHPLMLRAPFVYRTFTKPLGHAGDYQMVNQILGDPRDGPSTYFELVNFMFLQASVARAHRNRVDLLHRWLAQQAERSRIEGRRLRVLNVGCGPAVEIARMISGGMPVDHLDIDLVDFNEEALACAEAGLHRAAQQAGHPLIGLTLRRESVHRLLKQAARTTAEPLGELFDVIYCAGLFDYLADKACSRLLGYFAKRLRAGGRLLVTNVHSSNPERYWMEHFMEWYLIYRNEADITRLFPTELPVVHTYTDATGVNLFAEAAKPI